MAKLLIWKTQNIGSNNKLLIPNVIVIFRNEQAEKILHQQSCSTLVLDMHYILYVI